MICTIYNCYCMYANNAALKIIWIKKGNSSIPVYKSFKSIKKKPIWILKLKHKILMTICLELLNRPHKCFIIGINNMIKKVCYSKVEKFLYFFLVCSVIFSRFNSILKIHLFALVMSLIDYLIGCCTVMISCEIIFHLNSTLK